MANRILLGVLALSAANAAWAGAQLGQPLGSVLGVRLGEMFPILGGGLLTVAAVSLVIGIGIARRKQKK